MAVGNWSIYSNAKLELTKGQFNLSADTLVMVLLTAAYTPAVNTDKLWSDVSANEVGTGGGYTAGGVVMAGLSDTLAGSTVTFTANPSSWNTFTATFRYALIVRRAGVSIAGTDLLLAYVDGTGGGSITGGGGTLTITPNASGILTF